MNVYLGVIFANAVAASGFDGSASGLGLGIVGGEPNGVSIGWRLTEETAVQTAAGWNLDAGMLKVNTDYITTLRELSSPADELQVTVYAGGGVRVRVAGEARVQAHNQSGVGARIPIGIRGVPRNKRLDFFIEVAPSMMLLPDTSVGLDFGLGVRIWTGS